MKQNIYTYDFCFLGYNVRSLSRPNSLKTPVENQPGGDRGVVLDSTPGAPAEEVWKGGLQQPFRDFKTALLGFKLHEEDTSCHRFALSVFPGGEKRRAGGEGGPLFEEKARLSPSSL